MSDVTDRDVATECAGLPVDVVACVGFGLVGGILVGAVVVVYSVWWPRSARGWRLRFPARPGLGCGVVGRRVRAGSGCPRASGVRFVSGDVVFVDFQACPECGGGHFVGERLLLCGVGELVFYVDSGSGGGVDVGGDDGPCWVSADAGVDAVDRCCPIVLGQLGIGVVVEDAALELLLVGAFDGGVAGRSGGAVLGVGDVESGAPDGEVGEEFGVGEEVSRPFGGGGRGPGAAVSLIWVASSVTICWRARMGARVSGSRGSGVLVGSPGVHGVGRVRRVLTGGVDSPVQHGGGVGGGVEFACRYSGAQGGDRVASGEGEHRQVLAQDRVGGAVGQPERLVRPCGR